MELKYEAIGKVKLTKAQYWELKAHEFRRMVSVISSATFVLGLCIGLFLGTF